MNAIDLTAIRFDQPHWLWLSAAAIPMAITGWLMFVTLSTPRKLLSVLLRCLLLTGLAIALAEPSRVARTDNLAVVALIDTSDSVRGFAASDSAALSASLATALAPKAPGDLAGIIAFDALPAIVRAPRAFAFDSSIPDRAIAPNQTNIAAAIEAGLASIPPTAAARLILISDGNQTDGDALAAAKAAASRQRAGSPDLGPVPIDVVPLTYSITREVAIDGVDVPPRAAAGDTINVRVTLNAAAKARGNLTLRIDGAAPPPPRSLELDPGITIVTWPITLTDRRIHRISATFEPVAFPDGTASDTVLANNTGSGFTISPGRGNTLVVSEGDSALSTSLRTAGLPVEAITPQALADDPLDLQSADLIILDDVPADAISERQQSALVSHIKDFGAGLIMTGGRSSFGAGGWRGSLLEPLLPVRLDLPDSLVQPELALVLVLDSSGSMNRFVMGSTRSQMDIATEAAAAAVRTLDKRDQVGVIEFNSRPRTVRPLSANSNAKETAQDIESISADGGTNLPPALNQAVEMLSASNAKARHVIVLSDGRSMGAETLAATCAAAAARGIQVSTISVGDDADIPTMEEMARQGRGKHYAVLNPSVLPRVFLRAIRIIRAPLVRETPFVPRVTSAGSLLIAGLNFDTPLEGVTLTRRRDDPLIDTALMTDQGEPLLAHWNVGLGRVACFTSDTSTWSRNWIASGLYQRFWSQTARALARSTSDSPLTLTNTPTSSGMTFTLRDGSGASGTPLSTSLTIYPPDGQPTDLSLTPAEPGVYRASLATSATGTFIAVARATRDRAALPATIAGGTRQGNREFATLTSNDALLASIASATGGRVLDLKSPQTWDVFNRRGIVPRESWSPLWPWVLAIIAGLTLLDLAARRIAWDRWSEPLHAQIRARTNLDSLKSAVAGVNRDGAAALSEADGDALRARARDTRRAQRLASFASTSSGSTTPPIPATPTDTAQTPPSQSADPAPGESSLQAAKRRAKSRFQGDQ